MINIKIKEQKEKRKDTEQRLKITSLCSFICIFAFLSLISNLCYAQSAKEIKKEREKIAKQGIKTRTETEYRFREKSGEYKREFSVKQTYKYDNKGNEIEWDSYGADGKLISNGIDKYDDKGNEIEWDRYGADGKLDGKDTSKYDDEGNEIEKTGYNADGKLLYKITYKYDNKGNRIEETRYNTDGKPTFKGTYRYDNKGNAIEVAGYDSSGKLNQRYNSKYNDKGDVNEVAIYDADGKLTGKSILKYEYDDNENEIEESVYRIEDGKEIPQSQTVYEYTFYDQSKEKK